MRNRELAADHLRRAEARLKALDVLMGARSWADVVHESQEVVELALKGVLRAHEVDPPRIHDVADVLLAEKARLPLGAGDLEYLVNASRHLRRDRELAFYGTDDLTPSDFYREQDAAQAMEMAKRTVAITRPIVEDD